MILVGDRGMLTQTRIDTLKEHPELGWIRHRTEDHVRAHVLVCLLAYYVQWHLKRAWAPLLFEDEQLPADRATRDPVASCKRLMATSQVLAATPSSDRGPRPLRRIDLSACSRTV